MALKTGNEKTIAVLFGGRSSEHEISLRSAVFILKNIPLKYKIIPVGINKNGSYRSLSGTFLSTDFSEITPEDLAIIVKGSVPSAFIGRKNTKSILLPYLEDEIKKDNPEFFYEINEQKESIRILNLDASCFFPVLHGQNGEDGRLQGLLELADLAYVGCDIRSSVIGIDKDIQKRLAKHAGVPIAKYELVEIEQFENKHAETILRIEANIGYPCFIKPNSLGSAVGTGRAKNKSELETLLKKALAFDQKALVEEPMSGTEVECAFLGNSCNPRITIAGEIATSDFYSYEEKYANTSKAELFIPARLSSERMQELKNFAKTVAVATGISGLCRIDFWNCKKTNTFIFNEINTIPGLTSISMFPKLWEYEGVNGELWIEEVIEAAYMRKQRTVKSQYGIKASL
nr:D-alanine--D-alanine ligase family protein [Pigmentibacter ruber]